MMVISLKDEIREILAYLRKYVDDETTGDVIESKYTIDLVLDYITNLQKENKEWSMIFDTFSKRPYAHKYLEEKKKELGNKKIIGLDSEMIYKDYYDYKSRCEKAIQREMELSYLCDTQPDEELLNILQGEDKDVNITN